MSKKYPGSEPPMTIGPYEPELGLDLKPDTRIADLEAENARLQTRVEEAEALAERRREASQALLDALGQPRVASGLRHGRSEVMLRIGNLHAAINAAPEEAREKERR